MKELIFNAISFSTKKQCSLEAHSSANICLSVGMQCIGVLQSAGATCIANCLPLVLTIALTILRDLLFLMKSFDFKEHPGKKCSENQPLFMT